MSLLDQKTWKNNNAMENCWVPNCLSRRSLGYTKHFFLLPVNPKYREIWIALAGKKLSGYQGEVYFCQDHFRPASMKMSTNNVLCLQSNAIPYDNMPSRLCRTCMSPIAHDGLFCVISKTIPSLVPPDIKPDLMTCRPEPLYQILTFCIPEMNLHHDPPSLMCYKCFHNIWLYFVFKITSNAVEKGLRGNLTAVEYGKMVLCRTCPQTFGTSFFVLAEETLMGALLKKMFLNDYPSDVVPLKVCLKCWNTLYKLKNFYEECVAADELLQRHKLMDQSGLSRDSKPSAPVPAHLDKSKTTANRLREFRKISHPYHNMELNIQNNVSYPHVVEPNIGGVNVATVNESSNNFQDNYNSEVSVIKFTGNNEQVHSLEIKEINDPPPHLKISMGSLNQSKKLSVTPQVISNLKINVQTKPGNSSKPPHLQHQNQNEHYERGNTWIPPPPYTKPIIKQKVADTWVPPTNCTGTIATQQNNTSMPPVVNTKSIAGHDNSVSYEITQSTKSIAGTSDNLSKEVNSSIVDSSIEIGNNSNSLKNNTSSSTGTSNNAFEKTDSNRKTRNDSISMENNTNSSTETSNNALEKVDSIRKTRSNSNSSKDNQVADTGHFSSKIRFSAAERIALAELMLMYGEPLKYEISPEVQFEAWIKIVKEFHKINNNRSFESIQKTWSGMKKKAELAFERIGPAKYQDQLVINYINDFQYDVEMAVENSSVDINKKDSDVNPVDDVILITDDDVTKNETTVESSSLKSCKSSSKTPAKKHYPMVSKKSLSKAKARKKKKGKRGRPTKSHEWGHRQKLELVKAMKKEYDKSLKNNELTSGKSPWKMIISRLAKNKYVNYDFDKLYYIWGQMKRSATIYEKNGLDLVDEEVWELIQIQNAVQKSLVKNATCTRTTETGSKLIQDTEKVIRNATCTNATEEVLKVVQDIPQSISKNRIKNNDRNSTPSSSNYGDSVPTSVADSTDNDNVSCTNYEVPAKTLPTLKLKLKTKSENDVKKKFHYWTDSEKIDFFKLIKQEFNSMVKSKEPIARPWHTVIQRIALRGYIGCSQNVLFSSWNTMRRNATLHENDRQMSILDCKVLRLLKLANKLKNAQQGAKMAKSKGDKKIQKVAAASKTVTAKKATVTPKTVKIKGNKHVDHVGATSDMDKAMDTTAHWEEDDDDIDMYNSTGCWNNRENMDLIDVLKSYGSVILKEPKKKNFWPKVVADFKAKGHSRRNLKNICRRWNRMLLSAKLAWAQQKESSIHDKIIIDFIKEAIEKKNDNRKCSNESVEDEDSKFDEISDRMDELSSSSQNEDTNTAISLTETTEIGSVLTNQENDDDGDTADGDPDDENYVYVSLADIERDCGSNIDENKTDKTIAKAELVHVSSEKCGVNISVNMQSEEVIVIDDSDEEQYQSLCNFIINS